MPQPRSPIRVLLVDDHRLMREGVRASLEAASGFEVVGECGDGESVLAACAKTKPDVILLDLRLPGVDGLEVARRLRAGRSSARVLMLTMYDYEDIVAAVRKTGAMGFVPKSAPPSALRNAILKVAAGKTVFPGRRPRTSGGGLSKRERQVLGHIASGAASREIASRLGLALRTIEKHRENISQKLKLKGTAALTRFAVSQGLDSATA